MKLLTLICAVGSLGIRYAFGQPANQIPPKPNLQGTWHCVSAIVSGKPLPTATTQLLRLTLTSDRYKTMKGPEVLFDSTYSVDFTKNPAEINLVGTEGDLTGKVAPGILAWDGNLLRICYVMPGLPRPAKFETAEESQAFLVTWQKTIN